VGVIPGLVLAQQPLSFYGVLGIIALAGIVVNNAIMLLDVADRRCREGADAKEAMRDAISQRARPIFLTTATTICGLLPLAFSSSPLWPPLAWTMIGGLTGSGLLTLLAAPALYVLMCGKKSRPRRLDASASPA
jgi:multidrug efflux pump